MEGVGWLLVSGGNSALYLSREHFLTNLDSHYQGIPIDIDRCSRPRPIRFLP